MSDKDPIMETCFVCRRAFQYGPGRYDGRLITAWDELVCDRCMENNHGGIVPETYTHIMPALRAKGIEPRLNANGFIVIEGWGN